MYYINKEVFTTKVALQNRVKSILYSYELNTMLSMPDFAFMRELFNLHPHKGVKFGAGLKSIGIRQNKVYKGREFYIIRADNTEVDISYLECIRPSSDRDKFNSVCRRSVSDFIINFRDNFFLENESPICAFTNQPMTKSTCHVDHSPPKTFSNIVDSFISLSKIDINSIVYKDVDGLSYFSDPSLDKAWSNYHNKEAILRVVSPLANLSNIRRMK